VKSQGKKEKAAVVRLWFSADPGQGLPMRSQIFNRRQVTLVSLSSCCAVTPLKKKNG